jgi:hypothetical protein
MSSMQQQLCTRRLDSNQDAIFIERQRPKKYPGILKVQKIGCHQRFGR